MRHPEGSGRHLLVNEGQPVGNLVPPHVSNIDAVVD